MQHLLWCHREVCLNLNGHPVPLFTSPRAFALFCGDHIRLVVTFMEELARNCMCKRRTLSRVEAISSRQSLSF